MRSLSRDCSKSKAHQMLRILAILLILLIQTANVSGNDNIKGYDLSEEDQADLLGYAKAYYDTVKEVKADLTKIETRYDWVIDNFANHKYPAVVNVINTLDKANFRKRLKGLIGTLSTFEDLIKVITDAKGDYDKAKAFMDRYRPDKNNPMRSLEQIGNALEDLNSFIEKIDPTGGIQTKPIREVIDFYIKATTAYKNALDRIETKIKERGGNGIGEGLTGTTDKDREFLDKFPGVTAYRYTLIKYNKPGTDLEEAEFWEDQGGRAFVWKDGNWQELRCGIAGLKEVFDGLFLANSGVRPNINTLLSTCDVEPEMLADAKRRGNRVYGVIYADCYCASEMLLKLGFKKYSQKVFVAKYIFDSGFTKKADRIADKIEHAVFVEGRVAQQDKAIKGVNITAVTPSGEATSVSDSGGWFSMILDVPSSGSRTAATVKVNVPGYVNYEKSWPLDGRCNRWYNITLQKNEVQVPELTGKSVDQAFDILEQLNLKPEHIKGEAASSPEQANIVIWQSPSKKLMVSRGTTVIFRAYDDYIPPLSSDIENPVTDNSDTGGEVAPTSEGEGDTQAHSTLLEGYDGGLFISGPAVMVAGESSSFSACDGQGKQYPPSGSYSWFSTMEDTLVLQKSGNPVRASSHKAGKATILLKYDGGSAWFDLKIQARVPDVTRMSCKKATGIIDRLNLVPVMSGTSDRRASDSNIVVSQSPAAGTLVDAETRISLEAGQGKAEDGGDETALFSMEGGETVEDSGGTDSLFSMEGGETVAEIRTDDRSPGQSLSLLGEKPGRGHGVQPAVAGQENGSRKDNTGTAGTSASAAPKLKLKYDDLTPMGYKRNTIVLWRIYRSHWLPSAIIGDMAPEMIENKKLYLKIDINGKDYYCYNYRTLSNAFVPRIPYRSIGRTKFEITCPGHPELGEINIERNFTSEDFSSLLNNSKKFVSSQSYNELSKRKQAYERALTAPEKELFDIDQSAGKYAELLVQQALSLCNLGRYDEGYQRFEMALEPLVRRIDVQFSWEKKPNNESQVRDLAYALMSRANMQLMVYNNKNEYMKNARDALNLLMKYDNQYDFKDKIVSHSMQIAEHLLTAGGTRAEAKPFYDLGIKYMPAEKLTRHKKNWEFWDNCYAVFVKGLPTADRR